MKASKSKLVVKMSWDKRVSPKRQPSQRGLLIDVEAKGGAVTEELPVNLALSIDRSGSMKGGRIAAAKEAARGVVARLRPEDRLSLVDFDNQVSVLFTGLAMNSDGRARAIAAIDELIDRDMTNLAGGWFEAANAVASVIEETAFEGGHVVLLSDGHANQGLTDPAELLKHAAEMAKRGITTSTVGIGEGFSPLQLDALAEGGRGRVHVAATPDEIADVVIGEVLGAQAIVARDLELKLHWPEAARVRHLGHFEFEQTDTAITIALGDIASGSKRSVPFLVDVPALTLGAELSFEARVKAKDAATGEKLKNAKAKTVLSIVSRRDAEAAERDLRVAERIGRLWESKVAFDAMSLNEAGDFDAAVDVIACSEDVLSDFSVGTALADKVDANLSAMKEKVSQRWDGMSKREAMFLSKKLARSEADHRKKRDMDEDWSDHL